MRSPSTSRWPTPRSAASRPSGAAEGPHPDVQGGCGPQGDGGAVAGDRQSLDEYPPSGHRLGQLEVDLVPPVVVGQDGLGDRRHRRRKDDDGGHRKEPLAGLPTPVLQRLGPVAMTVPSRLAPALAEPAVGTEGPPPVAALLLPVLLLAQPAEGTLATSSPSAAGDLPRSAPAARARAARCAPAGTPALRGPVPPACTSEGRRPPAAAACLRSSRRPRRSPPGQGARPGPCAPRTARRGCSGMRRRRWRTPPSPRRSAGRSAPIAPCPRLARGLEPRVLSWFSSLSSAYPVSSVGMGMGVAGSGNSTSTTGFTTAFITSSTTP